MQCEPPQQACRGAYSDVKLPNGFIHKKVSRGAGDLPRHWLECSFERHLFLVAFFKGKVHIGDIAANLEETSSYLPHIIILMSVSFSGLGVKSIAAMRGSHHPPRQSIVFSHSKV